MKTRYVGGKYPNQYYRRDKRGQSLCAVFGCTNKGASEIDLAGGICDWCHRMVCYSHQWWRVPSPELTKGYYVCSECETDNDVDVEWTALLPLWSLSWIHHR
jgi:hypothetical protein